MNIKRLVLGTAAGALAVTGAQAADLPVVVEPVDYVRICDAFGAGFYYIPGTETCVSIRGRVRADYNVFADFDDSNLDVVGNGYGWDDGEDAYRFRARAYIYMDSRTNTEFGLLRTFTELQFTRDNSGGTNVNLENAFIQFGGLTFGRTETFFAFLDAYYTAGQYFSATLADYKVNLAAYTFAFGNGFSASISVEDGQGGQYGVYSFNPNVELNGTRVPDLVGNIRVDQGWGSAQLMAAGHYVNSVYNGPNGFNSSDEDYGFAVGAGVNVNVPFGNGTQVGIQGTYGHGALGYVSSGANDGGMGGAVDGIVDRGDLQLNDAFSVWGGFSTNFTPTVGFALAGGYLYVDNGDIRGTSYDFSNIDVQGLVTYSPVAGMTFGLGVEYKYVDTDDFGDDSGLSTFFRAQRTF